MPPDAETPRIDAHERRARLRELLLVMSVVVLPLFFKSLLIYGGWIPRDGFRSPLALVASISQMGASLALLVYVLRRSGRRLRDLGARFEKLDLLRCLGLYAIAMLGVWLTAWSVQEIALLFTGSYYSSRGSGAGFALSLLAVLFLLVNAPFEDLIVRAYLMTEVRAIGGGSVFAVLLCTAVQSSYHLYQGWYLMLLAVPILLVFSIYYATTRRIVPIILAHLLQDLVALLYVAMLLPEPLRKLLQAIYGARFT